MLIKLQGTPKHPVSILVKVFGNRTKMVHVFTFDDKGFHTLDTSKVSKESLKRLKRAFKWVDVTPKVKETKKEVKIEEKALDIGKMKFFELKSLAKDKGMKLESNTKKVDILKYLKDVI